jgi:hypothetical protein
VKRFIAAVAVVCGVAAWALAPAAAAPALQSFYVVKHSFSDVGGAAFYTFAQILDVVPQGDGVRVREIALSGVQLGCRGTFVRAAERTLPHATASTIAGQDICALTDKRVRAALGGAMNTQMVAFAGETTSIVAMCSGREITFDLPDDDTVHWDIVAQHDSAVAEARRVFGDVLKTSRLKETFDTWVDPTPADKAVAARVISDLQSGRFHAGLNELNGPFFVIPGDAFPMATLLDQGELKFDKYEVVPMPELALDRHITGDVHLRVTVQRALGVVSDVAVVSGDPVLVAAATAPVRQWRFTPDSVTADQIDIRLRFSSPCPH